MSTQAKALPDNLDALAQRDDFKQVNADETIKTLKTKLDDAGVVYTSTDDKAELVWRWMDYQGVDFSVEEDNTDAAASAPETTDTETSDESQPASADQKSDTVADGDGSATEVKDDTSSPEDTSKAQDEDIDQQTDRLEKRRQAEHRRQKRIMGLDHIDRGAITASADEQILVTNTGRHDVFEPASQTMIKAGDKVTIKPTITASMKQITANIRQINSLRGDVLKINE